MSQLWQSALNQGLHPKAEHLNRSLQIDSRLWKQDIEGSIAHVQMLIQSQLVSQENGESILETLNLIAQDILNKKCQPSPTDEDVHSWIERELILRLGPQGSNVHIARSRNEQILLDVKLYLRSVLLQFDIQFKESIQSLHRLEITAGNTILPSYTHLRRAQPIYLKEYWEAHRNFWEQSRESFQLLLKTLNMECPMGAGAIHGTTLPTLPQYEATLLGFKQSPKNSLATISSRRFILEFMSHCTHWFLDLSRLMEDLILYSTDEFNFITFSSAVTTGSSMMPQKRNPDLCELIRGKSATVMGHYVGLMTLIKGLPMGYMKDLQEDKTHLFSVIDTMNDVLNVLPVLLESTQINPIEMEKACADPQLLATDLMEYLVSTGIPLREAHHQVAQWIKDKHSLKDQSSLDLMLDPKLSCETRYLNIQKAHSQCMSVGDLI